MPEPVRLLPAAVLGVGALLLLRIGNQSAVPLAGSLADFPRSIGATTAVDQTVNEAELAVAGMDAYLMRLYLRDSIPAFSLYIGYYQAQTQGKSIHSPKNCLPGAGWEPVESRPVEIALPGGRITANRYLLEKGNQRAVVYYWYQGRGRVSWNEYAVKWELLRDKALHGRSEEALVRLVVPVAPDAPGRADSVATEAAKVVVPALFRILTPLEPRA